MKKYVDRLVRCGYSRQRAREVCEEFVRNLSLIDLDFFICSKEAEIYVG